jgi:hypothetical protein
MALFGGDPRMRLGVEFKLSFTVLMGEKNLPVDQNKLSRRQKLMRNGIRFENVIGSGEK